MRKWGEKMSEVLKRAEAIYRQYEAEMKEYSRIYGYSYDSEFPFEQEFYKKQAKERYLQAEEYRKQLVQVMDAASIQDIKNRLRECRKKLEKYRELEELSQMKTQQEIEREKEKPEALLSEYKMKQKRIRNISNCLVIISAVAIWIFAKFMFAWTSGINDIAIIGTCGTVVSAVLFFVGVKLSKVAKAYEEKMKPIQAQIQIIEKKRFRVSGNYSQIRQLEEECEKLESIIRLVTSKYY